MFNWFVFIGLFILAIFLYFRFFKIPKLRNLVFVDGTLGAGKSFYCVNLAIRLYKRELRAYRIRKALLTALSFVPKFKDALDALERPMLYSNIPLRRVRMSNLTLDVLLRKVRIPYRSVVLIDEMSLVADQFDYKDARITDALRDFYKLFRHATKGGILICNSQSTRDLHTSVKSCLSDYFYLHHRVKFPLFSVIWMQEMAYSADKDGQAIVNARTGDIEAGLKMVLVPNKYFKYYDTYAYSVLTDGLTVYDDWYVLDKRDSAKVRHVLTFKKGRYNLDD